MLAKAAQRLARSAPAACGCASLADLRHPYSVDLYVEKVFAHARFVLVRLLGGLDYWRYGVDELSRDRAGERRSHSPSFPATPATTRASTLPRRCRHEDLRRALGLFPGRAAPDNAAQVLRFALHELGRALHDRRARAASFRLRRFHTRRRPAPADAPRALILFYRSAWLAGDTEPYEALAEALGGAKVSRSRRSIVTSLKDAAVVAPAARAAGRATRPT